MKEYHYTECGLDNIYLVNGFKITKLKGNDEEIFIHDIHGLNRAIGLFLVSKTSLLSGNEIRFIRTMLDLSQTTLAKLLGRTYQTVLSWEKNKAVITKTADHLLRVILFSYLNPEKNKEIYSIINQIADLDAKSLHEEKANKITFKESSHQWQVVA